MHLNTQEQWALVYVLHYRLVVLFTKLIHYIILALLFAPTTAVANLEEKTFLIMDYKPGQNILALPFISS